MEKALLMIMRVEKKVHKILKGFNGGFELTEFLLFLYDTEDWQKLLITDDDMHPFTKSRKLNRELEHVESQASKDTANIYWLLLIILLYFFYRHLIFLALSGEILPQRSHGWRMKNHLYQMLIASWNLNLEKTSALPFLLCPHLTLGNTALWWRTSTAQRPATSL